jgi:hypothetical protein
MLITVVFIIVYFLLYSAYLQSGRFPFSSLRVENAMTVQEFNIQILSLFVVMQTVFLLIHIKENKQIEKEKYELEIGYAKIQEAEFEYETSRIKLILFVLYFLSPFIVFLSFIFMAVTGIITYEDEALILGIIILGLALLFSFFIIAVLRVRRIAKFIVKNNIKALNQIDEVFENIEKRTYKGHPVEKTTVLTTDDQTGEINEEEIYVLID